MVVDETHPVFVCAHVTRVSLIDLLTIDFSKVELDEVVKHVAILQGWIRYILPCFIYKLLDVCREHISHVYHYLEWLQRIILFILLAL